MMASRAADIPGFDPVEFKKFKESTPVIIQSDMEESLQDEAKFFITGGIEKATVSTGVDVVAACKFIKESLDKQLGPCFHCVMG